MTNGKPVIVGLSGGLGNQLFQYAAGRSLAARLGTPLALDLSHYDGEGNKRRFELQPLEARFAPADAASLRTQLKRLQSLHRPTKKNRSSQCRRTCPVSADLLGARYWLPTELDDHRRAQIFAWRLDVRTIFR
jgi:hypothetical protein